MLDIIDSKKSKNLISYFQPKSPAAEAYRTLRTNLQYASVDKKIKSIVITSPEIQDGKTVSACNLAISMANTGKRVLLVDADLRRPNVHKQFNLQNNLGLTNIIINEPELDDPIHIIHEIPNLYVLTSGIIPPNPSELLASNKVKTYLNEITQKYDMLIIDTPPVCLVTDGAILSGVVDGVILTISANKTKIKLTQNALRILNTVNANVIGVVMTKVNANKSAYYYKY